MKKYVLNNKLTYLALSGLITSTACASGVSNTVTATPSPASTVNGVKSVQSPSPGSLEFEAFPESSSDAALEDEYNLEEYIESNKVLENIPVPNIDTYRVRFTSDGGAIFSVKAESQEILWQRKPLKLVFDTFQLLKISEDMKYFSRYSQIAESEIKVTNLAPDSFSKKANLVQTIGLSLVRKQDGTLKISGFTPVVIRQIEKKELPYKIEKLTLKGENTSELVINGEKTLMPWPGISLNSDGQASKVKAVVGFSSQDTLKSMAVLVSLYGKQYQLTKTGDNEFSGDIEFPAKGAGKTGLTIELFDKGSLESGTKYQGYTWIIPFIN